jgi:hypothetical protein
MKHIAKSVTILAMAKPFLIPAAAHADWDAVENETTPRTIQTPGTKEKDLIRS